MNRLLYVALLVSSLLSAQNLEKELQSRIIYKLASDLMKQKIVTIYIEDANFFDIEKYNKGLKRIFTCDYAEFVLTNRLPNCNYENSILFFTDYKSYLKNIDKAYGVFFWQKGRPNIILNGTLLKREGIVLPKEYEKFVE